MDGRYLITDNQIRALRSIIPRPVRLDDCFKLLDEIYHNQFINSSGNPIRVDLNTIKCLLMKDKIKENIENLEKKFSRFIKKLDLVYDTSRIEKITVMLEDLRKVLDYE